MRVDIWIGGAAGDGIASAGETFCKTCSRHGIHVFEYNSYQSVIRGGHVLFQVQASSEKVFTQPDQPDILIALNQDTLNRHAKEVKKGGGLLYNSNRFQISPDQLGEGVIPLPLPVSSLTQSPLMQNTVALGALFQILSTPFEAFESVIRDIFAGKAQAVQDGNVAAARAGYDFAAKGFPKFDLKLSMGDKRRLLMSGNQAIALGALAAGCKFYSAYPMTPASSILHYLAPRASKYGLVWKQAEDEIAAINMAIGAGLVGVRAMVGTSGGGFALMTEAVGLAGMTEIPVVIVESQRGGPSTGLPTKTEQGDLFQALGASQGEFPKAILAPLNIEDAFYATVEAFNLAEKYQCPVIILSDLLLSEHMETVDGFNLKVPIDRGSWAEADVGNGFKRYRDTDTGVSPRAVPGQEHLVFVTPSDEHDEYGVLVSDIYSNPPIRVRMMNKRMRKMEYILKDMAPPKLEGPEKADLTLVGWGSTYGMLRYLQRRFSQEGAAVNALAIRNVWPFQAQEVSRVLSAAKKTVILECNYTAQMARFIRQETGIWIKNQFLKFDGEPLYPEETYQHIRKVLDGKASGRAYGLTRIGVLSEESALAGAGSH